MDAFHLAPCGAGRDVHGDDVVGGKPIAVRFDWTLFDADTAQWEQAFSFDGGESWVHNWRMSFTRIER